MRRRLALTFLFLLIPAFAFTQDLASFEKRVSVHKLKNGLTVLLLRRAEAPVFSFELFVDAGSAQDPKGLSGLAHMFEHMAFKGTPSIGIKSPALFPQEKTALAALEEAYRTYDIEKRKIVGQDPKKVAKLEADWRKLADEATEKYVDPNAFGRLVETHGGAGLNASTASDETTYYYSLPANQFEFWAYLESERLVHPVFREFYKERDVVLEERRMRVDSQPVGRLVEQWDATAFVAHPYQVSGVGWASEISSVTASEAADFYKTYYTPANMTLSVVGDIEPATVLPIIEKYFGRIPAGPKPPELRTIEPPQGSERKVTLLEPGGQAWYLEGYHRPGYNDKDDVIYDVISDLLTSGRVSRLYRALVRDKKVALFAGGESGFPGVKYPHLFYFCAVPNQGKTTDDLASAFHEEIDKLKTTDVTDDELKMVKTRIKADLLRGLADNQGLASSLATFQTRFGDWRELFRQVERVEAVTKADIRRVANATFQPTNRTVALIDTTAAKKEAK